MNTHYRNPLEQDFTKESLYNLCRRNRYFKTVLVSYYKLTRNKILAQCIEDLRRDSVLRKICDEYILFLSGKSVQVDLNGQDNTFSSSGKFSIPEGIYMKDENIFLQELHKAMQNA